MTEHKELPPGQMRHGADIYMIKADGSHVPIEVVRKSDIVIDGFVREVLAEAVDLSAMIADFKIRRFNDADALLETLLEKYEIKVGGAKGNYSFQTFDGCMKITVAVQKQFSFGPELQAAKTLVDECLNKWSAGSGPELRAIVKDAFDVDSEGNLNRSKILGLLRHDIQDDRWQQAMNAIRDSQRIEGSKRQVRMHMRAKATDAWRMVSLDVASADAP